MSLWQGCTVIRASRLNMATIRWETVASEISFMPDGMHVVVHQSHGVHAAPRNECSLQRKSWAEQEVS